MDISLPTLPTSAPPRAAAGDRSADGTGADGFSRLLGEEPAADKPAAGPAKASEETEQTGDDEQIEDEAGTQSPAEDGSVEDGAAKEVRSEDGLEASRPVGTDIDMSGEFRSRPAQAKEETPEPVPDIAPELQADTAETPAPQQPAQAISPETVLPETTDAPIAPGPQPVPEDADAELPVLDAEMPEIAPLRAAAEKTATPVSAAKASEPVQIVQQIPTSAETAQPKAAARAEPTFADLVTEATQDSGEAAEIPRPRTATPAPQVQSTTTQPVEQTLSTAQIRAAVAQLTLAPTQETPQPAPQPKSPIVQKVVDQVAQLPTEPGTTTIRLKPHGMGIVEISVERTKDGRLDVDMRVQNPLVLDAMRNERGALSHLFQGNGANGSLSMDLFQPGAGRNGQDAPGDTSDQTSEPLADDAGEEPVETAAAATPKRVSSGLDILT